MWKICLPAGTYIYCIKALRICLNTKTICTSSVGQAGDHFCWGNPKSFVKSSLVLTWIFSRPHLNAPACVDTHNNVCVPVYVCKKADYELFGLALHKKGSTAICGVFQLLNVYYFMCIQKHVYTHTHAHTLYDILICKCVFIYCTSLCLNMKSKNTKIFGLYYWLCKRFNYEVSSPFGRQKHTHAQYEQQHLPPMGMNTWV